jgi:ABC-2 type transport system permease protein
MSGVAGALGVPRLERVGRVTQTRVLLSEWTKLRSLRSTRWALLVATGLTILLPVIFAAILSSRWGHMSPQERASHRHQPVNVAQAGVNVSQLALAVLGVLMITGEYASGMIRASFTVVPRRLPVLWRRRPCMRLSRSC